MERRFGMSAAALKYFAALFMLVDHADMVFHLMGGFVGPESLLYYLPRYIGRLSFPIFAYFVAEGCRRTHYFPKYLLRLGVFSAVAQLPFSLASGIRGGSVILTFFLAAAAVFCFERLSRRENASPALALLPLLGACALALLLNTDYGFPGVMLVFSLYLCGENRKRLLLCLGVGLALIYLVYQPLTGLLSMPVLQPELMGAYLRQTMPLSILYTLASGASVLLLAQYDGRLGVQSKWFFYWFYPLHLLALWGIKLLIAA